MRGLRSCTAVAIVTMLGGMLGACGDGSDRTRVVDPDASSTASNGASGPSGLSVDSGLSFGRGVPVQFRVVVASTRGTCNAESAAECDVSDVDCAEPPERVDPTETVGLCDVAKQPDQQQQYRLAPADIVGGVESAEYGIPERMTSSAITFELGGEQADQLADLSRRLPPDQQFAIVVGGRVVSAPTFAGPIPDGEAQISGDFTVEEARDLAEALRSGG